MTEDNIVRFRSIPTMYYKEQSGKKSNTLRQIDVNDERFAALKSGKATEIKIINSVSGIWFIRKITDYTEWEGWAVISWQHEDDKESSHVPVT